MTALVRLLSRVAFPVPPSASLGSSWFRTGTSGLKPVDPSEARRPVSTPLHHDLVGQWRGRPPLGGSSKGAKGDRTGRWREGNGRTPVEVSRWGDIPSRQ